MSTSAVFEARIASARVFMPDGTVREFTESQIVQFTPDGYLAVKGKEDGALEHLCNLPMVVQTEAVRVRPARGGLVLPG